MLLNTPFYDFNTIGVINTFQKYCSCSFDIKDANPINTYMFNFIKAYSYGYVEDFSSAEKCINEIEKINDINLIIPKGSLMHFYKTKGYIQYNLSKYKESFESLKHVHELNERSLEIAYMFLFKSAELSGNIDFIIKALKNEKTSSKIVYSIHEYYRNKHINNAKEIELSKYIVENFSTKRCNSKICCRFFLDELFQLTEKTRQYKLYFKYLLSLKECYIKKKEEFIFD